MVRWQPQVSSGYLLRQCTALDTPCNARDLRDDTSSECVANHRLLRSYLHTDVDIFESRAAVFTYQHLATMLNRVVQAVWPWSRKPEIKGPIVAVLELDGVLMKPRSRQRSLPNDNIHFDKVKTAADKAFAVEGLQAVALSINCPGGSPAQCELIAGYLRSKATETNVPILAFANDVAASGGYWLMCAADELYACNTSLVGSIGVVGNSFGAVDAMKRLGIERRLAHAGDKKVASDPFSEETEDQKALKKEVMESLHNSFIEFVQGRRSATLLDPAKNDVFSGKVWTGRDAAAIGVVDRVGTMQAVLQEKYGQDVHVKQFGKPATPWWAQMRGGAALSTGAWGSENVSAGVVQAAVDGFVEAVHVRSMWARYGL
eukprot:jgi/Ulvmu1/2152/UM129_0012.1